jgi:hypothetical protein
VWQRAFPLRGHDHERYIRAPDIGGYFLFCHWDWVSCPLVEGYRFYSVAGPGTSHINTYDCVADLDSRGRSCIVGCAYKIGER